MSIRTTVAITLCKSVHACMKKLGRNGRSLPGKLALKVDPNLISNLSVDNHTIVITGTNGKTTTSDAITGKQFVLNFGNLPSFYNLEDDEGKKKMKKSIIDIVVRYDAAYRIQTEYQDVSKTKMGSTDGSKENQFKDTRYLDKANREQIYILHDVRFLGRSSGISFNQESADVLKATFPFTYRKIIRVSANGYFY